MEPDRTGFEGKLGAGKPANKNWFLKLQKQNKPEMISKAVMENRNHSLTNKINTKTNSLTFRSIQGGEHKYTGGVGGGEQDGGAVSTLVLQPSNVGVGVGGEVRDEGVVSSLGSQQRAGVEEFHASTEVHSAAAIQGGKPVLGDSTK